MADRIRKVGYFKIQVGNRMGEGARILDQLGKSGVNLLAFTGFPERGRAQIDFIPDNPGAFLRAAKRAGLKVSKKKTGFLVQGTDRIGAVANIMKRLAAARINVTAIDAICAGKKRYGAILWVKPASIGRATRALRAS